MSVLLVGLSHHTAPVEVREKLAFAEDAIAPALAALRTSGIAEEAVILSTCNRVELYAATGCDPGQALPALRQFLLGNRGFAAPLDSGIYGRHEPESLEHLFRVVCGLDSMVLGETEILGQVKRAYDLALQHRATGRALNKAFQRAFNVAKQVRTETNIQRGNVSVASVAVDLAEKIFSALAERAVLVIGAGDTSEKTARALLSRGVQRVLVTNRSHDRAVALAAELGGQAVPFDRWADEFARLDIIISSTSAPHFILDRPKLAPLLPLRPNLPLLLIDIAVPRDVDPAVNQLENVFLYNIDDLQTIANDALRQRQEELARCNIIIRDKVRGLLSPLPTGLAPGPARLACGASGC
ncbi:MAG: glutamyl-tRNA reductase [Verrucomicrobia bacterium]|nr:glutamyl-tRNA reductase [Verrucomicrobiota bacterium]